MRPTLTVALLTRNRLPLLQRTLDALLPQLEDGDEVIVIDTGSTDGTRQWLDTRADSVRWASADADVTDFGAARNIAVREARMDAVAFLDDDCVPAPGWVSQMRTSLADLEAVGGLALFGRKYQFPQWWAPELCWTVGVSGPSLIRGAVDDYPSTSNLAAWRDQFLAFPFQETAHGFRSANIYLGGREDAQWWADARRRGVRTGQNNRAVALHQIPQERIQWHYVRQRARSDGYSAWARRPCPETAYTALHEAAESLVSALTSAVRLGPSSVSRTATVLVWSSRQKSLVRAARTDPDSAPLLRTQLRPANLVAAGFHALRRRSARTWYDGIRELRPRFRVPDRPQRLLIAAPTFLGDSLLLQPVVRMLAQTWPETAIDVWTNYPGFFRDLGPGVRPLSAQEVQSRRFVEDTAPSYDVTFAPYYEFGHSALWRRVLSRRGVTFDREAGFRRERDYRLAARTVEKDFNSHEILNLLRLVSLWPLAGNLQQPLVQADWSARERLRERYPQLAEESVPYVALQMRQGVGMKDWPLERWADLAARFVRATGTRVVVHDPVEEPGIAAEMIRMSGLPRNLAVPVSCGLEELIALLEEAKLAIGICSGPKHLAMALGTPTFTLYGPTDPLRWGALFDLPRHAFVRSPAGTLTSREHTCLSVNHAMLQISVDEALENLLQHFARDGG